ncbi:hypothetical protein ATCV1_z022L [Acanthocystis turfacea chlorella virus 1]|uniref:Uncharacterized protein z022L n=1 Tax=Chlorovirus heliozoae TaxID=322019 RepID=A7K7Y2_9PHYC|nr:hypothetical protein ATCV1_z022L [Acanthocystis turfacea chlorella virus 1]ABT16156.1 hypothetical protein ATCV1_z022L [Acanthocystis turfacea chlorella virus 1]
MKMLVDELNRARPVPKVCVKHFVLPPFLVANLTLKLPHESGLDPGFHYNVILKTFKLIYSIATQVCTRVSSLIIS